MDNSDIANVDLSTLWLAQSYHLAFVLNIWISIEYCLANAADEISGCNISSEC